VTLDDRPRALEVPAEQRADGLGIARLSELRRADEVAKDDRHRLPFLPSLDLGQGRSAAVAEACTRRVLGAAGAAHDHGRKLEPSGIALPLPLTMATCLTV
jgi:hypothetical protein